MRSRQTTVGVVGLGYWGPNLARNFAALPDAELAWLCDARPDVRDRFATAFPTARHTERLDDLLSDDGLDAIVLATPVPTHAELAVLMVGHLLQYHPGIVRLKQLVDGGELGDIRYIYGNRLNLGQLRADENALWSLGAHDVSVVLHLAGEEPSELAARGECYMNPGVEDVVFAFMRFPSGLAAHLHLSWLDPHKERRFTVVGATRMATFDDMAVERKLTVYDKGFDENTSTYGEYITRSGDIWSPNFSNAEPLRLECEHFLDAIETGTPPLSDGESGLRVVRVLEGLQQDLQASRRG